MSVERPNGTVTEQQFDEVNREMIDVTMNIICEVPAVYDNDAGREFGLFLNQFREELLNLLGLLLWPHIINPRRQLLYTVLLNLMWK